MFVMAGYRIVNIATEQLTKRHKREQKLTKAH